MNRFLASAWASVHGPSDPRQMLVAILEARFAGMAVAPGPRPIDWRAVHQAAADLPFEFACVRATNPLGERSAMAGLASEKESERRAAVAVVRQAVATAKQLGCATVVLELGVVPMVGEIEAEDLGDDHYQWTHERAQALLARRKVGRNRALDLVCRELFSLARFFPEMDFCLTTSRSLRAVADLAGLLDVFEDLSQLRFGYWHDAAICARREQVLGEAQGQWLETLGNRIRGISLGDASDGGIYLPPGAGGVDYGLLASYVPWSGAPLPVVLELDLSVPPGELAGMRSFLDKHGL
ncbi:MAG TPA: hypothetical protein VF384_04415 [Planctomycetota bacterium]